MSNEQHEINNITFSVMAETFLSLNSKRYSLEDRAIYRYFMDSDVTNFLLYTGRQVAKSTTMAAKQAIALATLNNFKIIHIMPQHSQLRPYILGRLDPFINQLARDKEAFPHFQKITRSMMDKYFTNGSSLHARAMYITADGARGLSGDWLFCDETQDLIGRNITIVKETISASSHKFGYKFYYAGTPKTSSNTMEYLRKHYTNVEPLMKCPHCGHYNYIEYEGVREEGYECIKCKKIIPPESHEYCVIRKGDNDSICLRVPQLLILPWKKVYKKFKDPLITTAEIYNEVLALPYSVGSRPITANKLMEISTGEWYEDFESMGNPNLTVFAGLDPGAGSPSRTVLVIGTVFPTDNKFRVIAYYKFDSIILTGEAFKKQALEIVHLLLKYKVKHLMIDFGFGLAYLAELEGNPNFNVISIQYTGPNQKQMLRYEQENNRFLANRTQVMQKMFNDMNNNKLILPRDSADLHEDILHIFAETNKRGYILYNHLPNEPDDGFHALTYCYLMSQLHWQQLPDVNYYY